MKRVSKQIEELQTKHLQLVHRLSGLRSRQARIERAQETRRLILAGKFMLKLCQNDMRKLGAQLTAAGFIGERDRSLFESPHGPSN
jgi:hypothetical protein